MNRAFEIAAILGLVALVEWCSYSLTRSFLQTHFPRDHRERSFTTAPATPADPAKPSS